MTKHLFTLSLVTFSTLYGADVVLDTFNVAATTIDEVAQNAKISGDVAQELEKQVPSIDLSRRSGIANDILIRGQKRDNISVTADGTKVYGACPNRMDPPISHILANQIQKIEVVEGPYDVENFGTLSGGIKITTKKPTKEEKAELNVGFGSWQYKKFAASASGGNDTVRFLLSASRETSNQYRDGEGHSIADQIDNYIASNPTLPTKDPRLQNSYHDMPAYAKSTMMAKLYVTTAKNQELRLSYTLNRSDDVLYGNSKMDALYDDSNIYNVEYNIDALTKTYTNLNMQYYHSDVDHPMSTKYRLSALAAGEITSHLYTDMDGAKIKNKLDIAGYITTLGIDASKRVWDGTYYKSGVALPAPRTKSIDNTQTKNLAVFAKTQKKFDAIKLSFGLRYDTTEITNDTYNSNDYDGLSANVMLKYTLTKEHLFFIGAGQAYRVPDARELYFKGMMGNLVGTPNLQQVKNNEVDLGYQTDNDYFKLKIKAFYSDLQDYIYYNTSKTTIIMGQTVALNAFENVDAYIYGGELEGSVYATDDMSIDFGLSYKRGKKKTPLTNQTDTNLADMAPLRGNIALVYDYKKNSTASFEMQASDRWDDIDVQNKEQVLAGWAIFNAKIKHAVNKKFDFTLGVNNMFDITYAKSNTYADLTLITSGTTDVMLMNEPGRYVYTNLDFKF